MILIHWGVLILAIIVGVALGATAMGILHRLANAHGQVTGAGGGAKDARIE